MKYGFPDIFLFGNCLTLRTMYNSSIISPITGNLLDRHMLYGKIYYYVMYFSISIQIMRCDAQVLSA